MGYSLQSQFVKPVLALAKSCGVPSLPAISWAVIFGMFLGRIGTSMTVPFLTLFLTQQAGLQSSTAGLIVGAMWVSYACSGLFGGMISDRIGRKLVLIFSLCLYSVSFFLYWLTGEWVKSPALLGILFLGVGLVAGLSRSWSETMGQTLLAEYTPNHHKRQAFALRYTAANVGAAIGPALGAVFGLSGGLYGFLVSGIIFLAYAILFFALLQRIKFDDSGKSCSVSFREIGRVISQDHRLLYFVIALTMINFGFSQHETLFAQMVFSKTNDLSVFSTMLSLNAVLVIVFQMPILHWLRKHPPLTLMIVGSLFVAAGLLTVGLSTTPYHFYVGEILLTVGEILVFPFSGVVVDGLAKENMKGSYFGATTFQHLGRATGPVFGGFLFQHSGGGVAMTVIACLVLVSIVFFRKGSVHSDQGIQSHPAG